MKIQFLGTAAAEAVPAIFCECDMCRYAREKGGREIRTRSGSMIDDTLKIDFGPDSYKHMIDNRLTFSRIKSVLVTHTHSDHLLVTDLSCRRPTYAQLPDDIEPMTVYGNAALGERLKPILCERIAYRRVVPFESVEIEGYTVTPLEAVHCVSYSEEARWPVVFENRAYSRSEEALFYLIEKDGKSILYAHDTDEFTLADMDFLAGRKIDLISLDCTNGKLHCDYVGHMGADDDLRMREKLLANGAADEHTVFVAHHFSHNGLLPYEEMEKLLPGFIVSYDGLTVEV